MVSLDKRDPTVRFDFRSWILYDPRPSPGQRYIALMNENNDPVCEGYYLSAVINTEAPLAMTCFRQGTRGRGDLRFHTLQQKGLFAGKSAGTGILETETETVLFVHGATAEETQRLPFKQLWEMYGGQRQREFAESEAIRISSLPKLDRDVQMGASVGHSREVPTE
jgi:hypothetical protein